jgi:Domain of unknown function (DUF4476)
MKKTLFSLGLALLCTWSIAQPRGTRPHDGNQVCCDQPITRIESRNKMFFVVYQDDGNLVLYTRGEKPLWASNTGGISSDRCLMQADGNVVIYKGQKPVWASNTYGNPNAKLIMQDDGNLVIYDANNKAIWASNTVQIVQPQISNAVCCDQTLGKIESENKMYYTVYQDDGNLVLYTAEGKPLWASNTGGIKSDRCLMQTDGNVVIYNGSQPTWSSNTYGNPNARLVMQDDGNLVIYTTGNKAIWASNTVQPKIFDTVCCDHPLDRIESPNKKYFTVYQKDGNLVLYTADGKPLWASNTGGIRSTRCVMQADGNLVIYNENKPTWASNTYGGANRNAKLVMQDDGNLVLYTTGNKAIWASNTVQSAPVQQVETPAPIPPPVSSCEMADQQYQAALAAVDAQTFRDSKMSMAKQAIKNKCLSLDQIRGLAKRFSFEDQTLDFLKYAYDFTNDKSEYYTLSNIFTFDSNTKNFMDFLEKK